MQPLRITAHLAGSIALSRAEDLALDGILATQVLRRHFGAEFAFLPDPKEVLLFARLPLEMRGQPSARAEQLHTGEVWIAAQEGIADESLWYWSCSSAQIDVAAHDTQYWNKRFDTQPGLSDHLDFGGRVEKILIEQGRYKNYHMPLPTLVTDKVVWYAYGDQDAVRDLLTDVFALGKKRSIGNGSVLSWEIEPIQEDWSTWRKGHLMRPLPGPLFSVQEATPLNMQHIAYRAPQWHPANQALCVTKAVREHA